MKIVGSNIIQKLVIVALFGGSFACSHALESSIEIADSAARPTITSNNLEVKNYQNGILTYKFNTPLLEHYKLSENPYMIFTKGVHLESYDTLGNIKSKLDAEYAHYDEVKKIWEAKGNVVARDSSGKIIYSQQIYLDETKKIYYSNVDTKVVDGDEVTVGSGFEADEKFENIKFRQTKGRILIDTTKNATPNSHPVKIDTTKNIKK